MKLSCVYPTANCDVSSHNKNDRLHVQFEVFCGLSLHFKEVKLTMQVSVELSLKKWFEKIDKILRTLK